MHCPLCHAATKVTDSRPGADNTVRRSRRCDRCGHRFTTWETMRSPAAVAQAATDLRDLAIAFEQLADRIEQPWERRQMTPRLVPPEEAAA